MTHDLLQSAHALLPRAVELRRRLHRHPEVGNHTPLTRAAVLDELADLPLEVHLHETTSGIVAVLRGGRPGPAIVLRGDMDGLPMGEDTGEEFASETGDTMHACGHDLHTAMLAGAARLLCQRRDDLPGSVVFMFQPGEEGHAGARFMLDEGLLDVVEPRPTGAFAIHVTAMFPSGVISHRPGPQMASADEIRVTVTGRGGHASAPYLAADPVPVAAEIVLAVQAAVTRRFNALDPIVVTFGRISGGTTNNVIPESVELVGTIRALSEAHRAAAQEMVRRVATNVAAAHELEADLWVKPGYPISVNDDAFAAFVTDTATELVGSDAVVPLPWPIMGAEDWSYVMQQVPGTMAFLGACPPDLIPGEAPNNHSNRVTFDEPAMARGIALYAAVAEAHLAGG